MREGDDEGFSFVWRGDVAHDATLVADVPQFGDKVSNPICGGRFFHGYYNCYVSPAVKAAVADWSVGRCGASHAASLAGCGFHFQGSNWSRLWML